MANIQYFGVEEGLSHREVYTIHQDHQGFLWVGTKYGLNRFDGYEFKWFTKNKYELASNTIHHILEDGEGKLWLFESFNWRYFDVIQAVSILDPQRNTVIPYDKKFGKDVPVPIKEIDHVISSPEGRLYFGIVGGGFYSYHVHNGWEQLIEKGGLYFRPMLYTPQGTIWGTGEDNTQLIELDTLGNITNRINLPKYPDPETRVSVIHLEREQYLWLQVYQPQIKKLFLLKVDLRNTNNTPEIVTVTSVEANDPFASYFHQQQNNYWWYKGTPQLKIWKEGKTIFDLSDSYPQLAAADIHDIYFDKANHAWIGSFYGLYQVDLQKSFFQRYLYTPTNDKPSADFYSSRGIWADNKKVVINTYKGAHILSKNGKKQIPIPETQFTAPSGIPQRMLVLPHAIVKDSEGKFWFGDIGLVRMDSLGGQAEVFPYEKFHEDDIGGMIWSICQDKTGKIWIGTQRGFGYFDKQAKVCRAVNTAYPYEDLNGSTIYSIINGPKDHLYLCTNSGVYVYDTHSGIIGRYWTGGRGQWYIPTNNIKHLSIENEEYAWLASYGSGLLNVPIQHTDTTIGNAQLQQYSIEHGLANNNLYAVYQDKSGNLWLSSDYGIIAFNTKTFQSQTFFPKDGTTHEEFNTISHFKAADGRLYFGSLNGVTAFYPEDVLTNDNILNAPLVITSLHQYDRSSRSIMDKLPNLNQKGNIVLRPGEGFFDLSFAALTFQHVDKTRYLYKVEGLDKDWTYTKEPSIRFSGLPYGKYTLRIRAQGHDGKFAAHTLDIPISVLTPIYFQEWFLATIFILSILIVVGGHKLRMFHSKQRQKKLKRAVEDATKIILSQNQQLIEDKTIIENQANELQKLDTLKSRFFANISHELRTPLTLLLGPIKSLTKTNGQNKREKRLLQIAEKNVKELLNLVNEILDLSKLDSQMLELNPITVHLYGLIQHIATSFQSMAREKNISFSLAYDAKKDLYLELDEGKFKKILNNLLSNAIKFTESNGEIEFSIADKGNCVLIKVRDSGKGIHPDDIPYIFNRFFQSKQTDTTAQGGTGIGLALSKDLVGLMNGKIWVESRVEHGSTFFFELPKKEILNRVTQTEYPTYVEKSIMSQGSQAMADASTRLGAASTLVQDLKLNANNQKRNHVLLVEDNQDLVEYISIIIGEKYDVDTSSNGQEALKLLKEGYSLPDIILCDIMMPIMDGLTFLRTIKSDPLLRHIPVIMLTAKATKETKLRALKLGVDDYLNKPFDEEELKLRIEYLLKNAEERKKAIVSNSQKGALRLEEKREQHPHLMQVDIKWLEKQETFLRDELNNTSFNISYWADKQNMSERNLQRRLKQLTGLSPHQYMAEARLQKARKLIEIGEFRSLSEVAYGVGFSNLQTFSRNFKKRFGKAPSNFGK